MGNALRGAILAVSLALTAQHPARAAEPAPGPSIDDIAASAYLYFYSLLTMDLTRLQATNVEPGKELLHGPTNMFSNAPTFPPADFKLVVRPNFDTLYSSAWLDLTKEPMIVSVPDTGGRYYLLPMLDMWTDVFASPGWRTTGTKAQDFLVAPQGWTGAAPAGVTRIDAPTGLSEYSRGRDTHQDLHHFALIASGNIYRNRCPNCLCRRSSATGAKSTGPVRRAGRGLGAAHRGPVRAGHRPARPGRRDRGQLGRL